MQKFSTLISIHLRFEKLKDIWKAIEESFTLDKFKKTGCLMFLIIQMQLNKVFLKACYICTNLMTKVEGQNY